MSEKSALRRELLALRSAISPADKQAWDAALSRVLTKDAWFRCTQVLLAYYPIGSEPDIRPLLEEALQQSKRVYLPRCKHETREMAFYQVQSLANLRPGAHGIPEPEESSPALRVEDFAPSGHGSCVTLCIVPGVAFDRAGFRLGYGGGYYDRFLARHGELRTLGVCYGMLLRDGLPNSAMDQAVERVLTEKDGLQA